MPPLRLLARWVVPVTSPPVERGAVLVDGEGRIEGVGREKALNAPSAPTVDLGDVILMPGLVNAHAHLELTALRGAVRERPFPEWVRMVRLRKEALPAAALRAAARWGVLEHFAAGITTIGDVGSSGEGARAMAALGARGTAYQEVFGPDPERLGTSLAELEAALAGILPLASQRLAIGVSPHAPYTVSAPLLEAVCLLAARRSLPVAMHLAESPEEHELISGGGGPFAERLEARGIPVAAHGCSPVQWALSRGLGAVKPLCIHCVNADDADLAALAAAGASVAHCPWSNALLGNARAPLNAFRAHGITVGVGTDSAVPGGATDLLADLRLAIRGTGIPAREALRLVTVDATRALGGRGPEGLAPGSWADLAALRPPPGVPVADPEDLLVARASACDVVGTWVAGKEVYRDGTWPGVDTEAELREYEAALGGATRPGAGS